MAKNKNNKAVQNNKYNAEIAEEFNANNEAENQANRAANQARRQNQK